MESQIPVVTANSRPFRLVTRGELDSWNATLETINRMTYDYVKLSRISMYIEVPEAPFLGICYDGTLVLPAIPLYRDREEALSRFNKTLLELFLGGLYCEAADPDDIGYGTLSLDGYSRIGLNALGRSATFHSAARTKMLSTLDSIKLLEPESVQVEEVGAVLASGRQFLARIGAIPREQLLYGTSFFVRKQWSESLVNIWTVTEALVERAWEKHILDPLGRTEPKRRTFLRDHRTWTMSTKLELLRQKNLLPEGTHALLSLVKKARNDFVHKATAPTYKIASQAIRACFEMASLCATGFQHTELFRGIEQLVESRCNPELFPERSHFLPSEIRYHIGTPIPPLPGEVGWGDRPFENIPEIKLRIPGK